MGRPKGSRNRGKVDKPLLAPDQTIYEITALNMPAWLTFVKNENPNQIKIRKTRGVMLDGRFNEKKGEFERAPQGDRDEVLTPSNEEVLLICPEHNYSCNLTLQDLGRFREWKEFGGPHYDPEQLKVNPREGSPMVIATRKQWDAGQFPIQPWEKRPEVSPGPSTETLAMKEILHALASLAREVAELKAKQ